MIGNTLITPSVSICAVCGIRVPTGVNHSCAGGIPATGGSFSSNVPLIDPSHWLYKAGYEVGAG